MPYAYITQPLSFQRKLVLRIATKNKQNRKHTTMERLEHWKTLSIDAYLPPSKMGDENRPQQFQSYDNEKAAMYLITYPLFPSSWKQKLQDCNKLISFDDKWTMNANNLGITIFGENYFVYMPEGSPLKN